MPIHFIPNCYWNKNSREIGQHIYCTKFIQMNQWPGIGDNHRLTG